MSPWLLPIFYKQVSAMSDESSPLADDAMNADPIEADEGAVWYFRHEKQAFGPVSFAQLRRRIGAGKLKPSDQVRRKGDAGWRRADAVPNLCAADEEQECEQAAVPRAKRRETATVETAERLPAQKATLPARKKSRVPVTLAGLAVAAVLVVVILAAGVAAYLIYDKLTVNIPANPVGFAVIPPPPVMNPIMPPLPGTAVPLQVEQAMPQALPVQPQDDPVQPKGDALQPPPPQGDPAKAQVVPDGVAGFVFMEAPEAPAEIHSDHQYWILLREIVRQSLLLGAREELGLTTRDAVLGEAPPPGMPEKNLLRATS
ncbi:MAG TPA: GYF domain-containing protein, partial [Planctomycetaceae bacterium]|nr:GYF domain-containing protein [Planctomycetaceae bacterium]